MNRLSLRTSIVLATVLVALPMSARDAAGADSPAKPKELKLSTAVGPAFALGEAGERWARGIGETAGAGIAVKIFPGATLAGRDPTREFAALRDGAVDLAVGSSLFWAPQVVELNVIGLPWIAADAKQIGALINGAMRERLDSAIERAGAVPIAYAALGFRALATTDAAVNAPGDLANLAIRVTSTPYVTDLFVALGAAPRTLSFTQAQVAMKDGTIAAQEGSPATFAATRLDALGVRHVALWGAVAEVAVFAANRAAWTALTDAERALISDAAREVARELPELARLKDETAVAGLIGRGVVVTRPTATGRAAFAFAARGAYEKWAAIAGIELVRAAEAAISASPP